MAAPASVPETVTQPKGEAQLSNGWEKLLPLLDPAVVQAPHDQSAWQHLNPGLVVWLIHTVAAFPWLNHLALEGVITHEAGIAQSRARLQALHSFFKWAIPEQSPTLAALEPETALIAYYGDPPHTRGLHASTAYTSYQFHLQRYLQSLSAEKRTALIPFLLPNLVYSARLRKLRIRVEEQVRLVRKEQAFSVTRDLPALVALARQRYKWLADLEKQFQCVAESVRQGQTPLPAVIQCQDLDHQTDLVFRVWDRTSWIQAHRSVYARSSAYHAQSDPHLFLQLVGPLPQTPWFLRAAELGLLTDSKARSSEARRYTQEWDAPFSSTSTCAGLLYPHPQTGKALSHARKEVAKGTPEDSRALFCIEPLLSAATVGLFTLVSLVQTGMRIGELMQVTLDRECIESGFFPQFDDHTGTWRKGPERVYWRLYPKGSLTRERFLVTDQMLEAMKLLVDLHERYYGPDSLKPVPAHTGPEKFSHTRRFKGKHKFVLQWQGKQISSYTLRQCLSFLLLEHNCRDQEGKLVRITAHVLRHGMAGWLRNQGVPLDDIMALLKQVNLTITDYYSRLSPSDLYRKVGPALTALAELADIDPSAIRTVGDLHSLAQEALKRYGVLRHTPGGMCSVFIPCEVQFKCASCPYYIPDPVRRSEIEEKIVSHSQAIRLFGELGDYLQADVQKAHLRAWERIEKEIDALTVVDLVSPPTAGMLKDLGMDRLGEELLLNLKPHPCLSSGDSNPYAENIPGPKASSPGFIPRA